MATAVASVTLSLSRYRTRKTIADRKSDRSCSRAERINGPQVGTRAQAYMPPAAAGIQPAHGDKTAKMLEHCTNKTGTLWFLPGTGDADSATPRGRAHTGAVPSKKGSRS